MLNPIPSEVDVAVIGAGSAGLPAFRAAREHTDRVILIERGPHGTTCARVGCMPSKLLIAAAEAAHGMEIAPGFGIHPGSISIDGEAVMERVRRERDRFVGFVLDGVDRIDPEQKISGQARFVEDSRLEIGNSQVRAGRVVIASGTSPAIPNFLEEVWDRVSVNDDVFEWKTLPESVAVFGAGVIALELGQALHRLGVRVRLFGRSLRTGPITDPGVLQSAEKVFSSEFPFTAPVKVENVESDENGVRVLYRNNEDSGIEEEVFEQVLAATGRHPNLTELNLEQTSLKLDSRGIPVYNPLTMQCGNSPVFIAGDVNNTLTVLHEAADEGRIAGDNAGRFPDVREGRRSSPMTVVFTDPQMAVVGKTWKDLQGRDYVMGSVSFEGQGRSRVMLQNRGRLHLYAEPGSGRLLGMEAVGPRVEHLAHLVAWSHQQQLTVQQMLSMPFYHPVVEEGLRTALRSARDQL
ncbi:MAG: dihydrolipoyl dehydrogenase [SAR324 cluster bacterium]|nr:dihydrolipoyl dehydrogenase [SAR324 cluster bacterium]